jgi:hypothetical protein
MSKSVKVKDSQKKIKENQKKLRISLEAFGRRIRIIILTIIFIWAIAIFLSIRCNGGFDLGGFLAAWFFAPIYIIYKLATMPKYAFALCLNK